MDGIEFNVKVKSYANPKNPKIYPASTIETAPGWDTMATVQYRPSSSIIANAQTQLQDYLSARANIEPILLPQCIEADVIIIAVPFLYSKEIKHCQVFRTSSNLAVLLSVACLLPHFAAIVHSW